MWVQNNWIHTKWNRRKQSHRHACRENNNIYHHKGHPTYMYVGVPEEEDGKMEKKNIWGYKGRCFYNEIKIIFISKEYQKKPDTDLNRFNELQRWWKNCTGVWQKKIITYR